MIKLSDYPEISWDFGLVYIRDQNFVITVPADALAVLQVYGPYILAKMRKMSYFDPYFSSKLGKMYSLDPPFFTLVAFRVDGRWGAPLSRPNGRSISTSCYYNPTFCATRTISPYGTLICTNILLLATNIKNTFGLIEASWRIKGTVIIDWIVRDGLILNTMRMSFARWRVLTNSVWCCGTTLAQVTVAQVMACCLTAPSHYLNHCWLVMSLVQWYSYQGHHTEISRYKSSK